MRAKITMLVSAVFLMIGALGIAQPAAAATTYNRWIPLIDEDFDSCSERVVVNGTQHIVGHTTQDATGQMHFVFTRNTHGTGVGTESGDEYLLLDTVAKVDLIGIQEGDVTIFTQLSQERLIHKGESTTYDDAYIRLFARYTITPDGEITVDFDIINAECR